MKKNWDSVNYETYLKLVKLGEYDLDEKQKVFTLISILSGKSVKDLSLISINELTGLIKDSSFIAKPFPKVKLNNGLIEINNVLFKVNYDLSLLTASEYIDIVNLDLKDINQLFYLMAILIKPVKLEYKNIFGKAKYNYLEYDLQENADFLREHLPYYVLEHIQVFFSKVLKRFTKIMLTLLQRQILILKKEKMWNKLLRRNTKTIGDGLDALIELQKRLKEVGIEYMI